MRVSRGCGLLGLLLLLGCDGTGVPSSVRTAQSSGSGCFACHDWEPARCANCHGTSAIGAPDPRCGAGTKYLHAQPKTAVHPPAGSCQPADACLVDGHCRNLAPPDDASCSADGTYVCRGGRCEYGCYETLCIETRFDDEQQRCVGPTGLAVPSDCCAQTVTERCSAINADYAQAIHRSKRGCEHDLDCSLLVPTTLHDCFGSRTYTVGSPGQGLPDEAHALRALWNQLECARFTDCTASETLSIPTGSRCRQNHHLQLGECVDAWGGTSD